MTSFLWERANNVAKDETAILQAPGDDSAWGDRMSGIPYVIVICALVVFHDKSLVTMV